MRRLAAGLLAAVAAQAAAGAWVAPAATDPLGRTTLDVRVGGSDRSAGFSFLAPAPGEPHAVREGLGAGADPARGQRRRSLIYFAQLTDFQLADEESPARVEALDPHGGAVSAAHRPQEALWPQMIDQMIRQVNAHRTSPVAQADGARATLAFALATGDNADNQQLNETEWVRTLLDGGRLDPNSGSPDPADYAACPPGTPAPEEGARYTGFQDHDDYAESTEFYDPDAPLGRYAGWPVYPGLMDEAQKAFDAAGLEIPSYVAFGNHDGLLQGNEDATAPLEVVATGCVKPLGPAPSLTSPALDLASLLATTADRTMLVPPDPRRRMVDKAQYKAVFADAGTGHGFGLVDSQENEASNGTAGYYSFSAGPQLRFIALDTLAEGGTVQDSSDGNLDDPQFRWLERQLQTAAAADELVVLFGHHSIQSLTSTTPDELAGPCLGPDSHGHDTNPGCDRDPRPSQPLHDGPDLTALLHAHPHVVAFVAGHSHVNDVVPFPRQGGGGFWNVRTSAEADWPHQQRLLEVMDNRDGTLSIFGTLIDTAGPIESPPSGTAAAGMTPATLASIGRTLGFNDPQAGGGTGEGADEDRNVELLVPDPRRSRPVTSVQIGPRGRRGRTLRLLVRVTHRGRPVRRAVVRAFGRRARTDRRGRARLTVHVPRGRRIAVTARKRGLRGLKVTVRVLRRR